MHAAVVRVSRSDAAWSDTVARFAQPAISVRGADGQALSRLPWDPMVLWDACENGEVIVGRSNAWRIAWYRDGASVGSVQRAVAADGMTDAEHDSLSQDWLERSPKSESFRTILAQRLAEKPSSRPHLHSVFCANNNRALVVNAPKFGDNHRVVDVLDRDGTVALSVRVPLHIRLIGVAGDDMFGIDQLGGSDMIYRIAINVAAQN